MNANQINARFAKEGLRVRIRAGAGYYYWLDDRGDVVDSAESVYVYRASHLPFGSWLALAREIDQLIPTAA